jgi:hypothetical protein
MAAGIKRIDTIAAGVIAVTTWSGLGLQLYISDPALPLLHRILAQLSFFTILSNLLVAVSLTSYLIFPRSAGGRFFSNTSVRSGIAVYICMVGIVYNLLLRQAGDPGSLMIVADKILHDAVPILYLVYWFIFVPKGMLTWKGPVLWLLFPFGYMIFGFVRGAITGFYPYYFADVAAINYPAALRNAALAALAFLMFGFVLVLIDKLMPRTTETA